MAKFILTRLGQLVLVVIVVTFVTAVVMSFIPGDPVTVIAPFAEGQQRDEIRADLNLDDPVPVRYVKWLGGFATGDLGNYYTCSSTRITSRMASRWVRWRTSATTGANRVSGALCKSSTITASGSSATNPWATSRSAKSAGVSCSYTFQLNRWFSAAK